MPRLRAKLYRVTQVRWVDIPRPAVKSLGSGPRINALLRFNDDLDRVTLLPGRPGHYKLAFKVELLRAAKVDAGDVVDFSLEADTASREPDLPIEMEKAFRVRPQLRERWMAHTVSLRRQVIRYIIQSKNPEVVARRCWIFIERLAETGKLGRD